MIPALFLGLLAFANQGSASIERLDKQIFCTPSKSPYQFNVGLAFSAPYKGTYGELPTADGTTFITTDVEIYDHTCDSPVYTNRVLWSDVNTTAYDPNSKTRIAIKFPVYPTWRRYGKKCYPRDDNTNPFVWKDLEEACEDYESLYNCDTSNQNDDSFCSIKLGNLTIETQIDGDRESRTQYSRLFKYARTDVGDACNCWQETDGYNYVFACGCAINANILAQGLPGLTPPGHSVTENHQQVEGRRVNAGSVIGISHGIGGPSPIVATHSSTTKPRPTISKHTSRIATSTKRHSTTSTHSARSTPDSKLTTHTKPHSSISHKTSASSTHKQTTHTTLKTTSRSSKPVPTTMSSKTSTASVCSLRVVSGTAVEHCAKETASSNHPTASLCSLRVAYGTVMETCA